MATFTLENLKTYTLGQVEDFYRLGIVGQQLYEDYYHLWYTSAWHDESIMPCYCAICSPFNETE